MKYLLFFFPFVMLAESAFAKKLEFSHGRHRYALEKTTGKFSIHQGELHYAAKVDMCSAKIFGKFWEKIESNVERLQLTTKGTRLPAAANLVIDGTKRQVLEFEPTFKFFYFLPQDATIAFAEAKKKCGK